MASYSVRNSDISLSIEVGINGTQRGLRIWRIRDRRTLRKYLDVPVALFEFAIAFPCAGVPGAEHVPRTSEDIDITHVSGNTRQLTITGEAWPLSFQIVLSALQHSAVALRVSFTNRDSEPIYLRTVLPKIEGLEMPFTDAMAMVPIEIGSVVPLSALGTTGTMGMPLDGVSKRFGVPISMNGMEVASIYDGVHGGGIFFADIEGEATLDRELHEQTPPIQLNLTRSGVLGFWISGVEPDETVHAPRIAIGVHAKGDWHEAVDFYLAERQARPATFQSSPVWFRDQAAVYSPVSGGGGGIYLSQGHIAALPDGAVWTNVLLDNQTWLPHTFIPLTQADLADPTTRMAVVARNERDEDLFVAGREGGIWWTWERNNGPWQFPAVRISTSDAHILPGTPLTAVARNEKQIDIFAVDAHGSLVTVFRHGDDTAPWLTIPLETAVTHPATPVSAIVRPGHNVDLFFTDYAGNLRWTYERNNGEWQSPPVTLPFGSSVPQGASITALARNSVQTDLFFVDKAQQLTTVYKTSADDGARWQSAVIGGPLRPSPGASVTAVVRDGKDVDVFVSAPGTGGMNTESIWHLGVRNNQGWSAPKELLAGLPPGTKLTAITRPGGTPETRVFFVNGVDQVVALRDNVDGMWSLENLSVYGFAARGSEIIAVRRSAAQDDIFLTMPGQLKSFDQLPDVHRAAKALGTNLVYLWDYWGPPPIPPPDALTDVPLNPLLPPYFNKGDYWPRLDLGGEQKLKQGIAAVQAQGGRVILYVEPFIIGRDSYVARFRPANSPAMQGEYFSGRFPVSFPLRSIACDKPEGSLWPDDYHFIMVPALREWQDHVCKVVSRLVFDYGADGVVLDSFGWRYNYPMRVAYVGPQGSSARDLWPKEYARGVLELTRRVRELIGPDKLLLTETPAGPVGQQCHGGFSADFGFHSSEPLLSPQTRITSSPVRYAMPAVRYFGNGANPVELEKQNRNQRNQIFAAGHGLALTALDLRHEKEIRSLVEIRSKYADALIHGKQEHQPSTGNLAVAAYYYRGRKHHIITVVNTSLEDDYSGELLLRRQPADWNWVDLLDQTTYRTAGRSNLGPITIPKHSLRVLLRGRRVLNLSQARKDR
ncbi:MAG TPA: hypothetical protein VEQ63_10240 [Bryobacteraceae bacterium]|nr:hypothetical protein [Bryobacteraceae bacterium]